MIKYAQENINIGSIKKRTEDRHYGVVGMFAGVR